MKNYFEIYEQFLNLTRGFRSAQSYKYAFGEHKEFIQKSYSEIKAPVHKKELFWANNQNEIWYKTLISIPDNIAGISTIGSSILLEYKVIFGNQCYVNGQKVLDEKWWTDTDIPLTDSFKPGEEYDITICIKKDDCNMRLLDFPPRLFIMTVEDLTVRISTFIKSLRFLEMLMKNNSIKKQEDCSLIKKTIKELPADMLLQAKAPQFFEYCLKKEKELSSLFKYLKKHKSFLIGHAHLDISWLWDWDNTLESIHSTFRQAETLMNEYPDFIFSQDQAAYYDIIEKMNPVLFKKITRKIKNKQWEPTAAMWVEGDTLLASLESIIRQFVYGQAYQKKKFNKLSQVCWCPDNFGHAPTLPQILKECGVKYYYFKRGNPEQHCPGFYWQGIDGSKILTFNEPLSYNCRSDDISLDRLTYNYNSGLHIDMLPYGVGNHGGGPTRRNLEAANIMRSAKFRPRIEFSTVTGFFKDLEKIKKLPVKKNDLSLVCDGAFTSHSDMKKGNRDAENLISSAETMLVMAHLEGFKTKKYKNDLKISWQNICLNQFHDTICGTSIPAAHEYARNLYKESLSMIENVILNTTQYLVSRISIPENENSNENIYFSVFNTCTWQRNDPVTIPLTAKMKNKNWDIWSVLNNKKIISQQSSDEICFLPQNTPAVGYKTFYLRQSSNEKKSKIKNTQNIIFENKNYKIVINNKTAVIDRFIDKKNNLDLLCKIKYDNVFTAVDIKKPANQLKLYVEEPGISTAWDIKQTTACDFLLKNTKIINIEYGQVYDSLTYIKKFGNSEIEQTIRFYKNNGLLEFDTTINWQETGNPQKGVPTLKASFPVNFYSNSSVYHIPGGIAKFKNDGTERAAQMWIDYSNEKQGIALLNDCKYGYNICGNNIEITLIRGSYGPDPLPEKGKKQFRYAILPHAGNFADAALIKRAAEFNIRQIPVYIENKKQQQILSAEKSYCEIKSKSVVGTCFKETEDNNGIIIRAYESSGKKRNAEIITGFKYKNISEVNCLEQKKSNLKKLKELKFSKFKIRTFKFKKN